MALDRLIRLLSVLNNWANRADWHTWVLHGLIAIPLAWVFGPMAAVAIYIVRELEQYAHELIEHKPPKYVDHIMDVLGPIVGVLGVKWVFHF